MDILNRSGRIPDLEDELNFIQQQIKQYVSLVDLREDEVNQLFCHMLTIISTTADGVPSCYGDGAYGRT